MLYNVVGGRWGDVIRPTLETAARGVVPDGRAVHPHPAVDAPDLPLGQPSVRDHNAAAKHQYEVWLHPGASSSPGRSSTGPIWLVMAWVDQPAGPGPTRPSSPPSPPKATATAARDQPTADHNPGGTDAPSGAASWLKTFSAPGLVVYAITISLAAIDWAMSLQPGWYSTIYGFLFIASQGLSTMAFCTAVLVFLTDWVGRGREPQTATRAARPAPRSPPASPAEAHASCPATSTTWAT